MTSKKYPYYLASIWKLLAEMQPRLYILGLFLGIPAEGGQVIELSKSGIRFRTRGVMDIWTIKETFLDRFYEKFGTPIGDGWTVVDIGAGIGDFSILAAVRHPKNMVFAFEPNRDSCSLLLENLKLNQVSNVRVYPEAIWSHSTELAIDTSASEPGQYKSRPIGEVRSWEVNWLYPVYLWKTHSKGAVWRTATCLKSIAKALNLSSCLTRRTLFCRLSRGLLWNIMMT